jgi:hypothetical protein
VAVPRFLEGEISLSRFPAQSSLLQHLN